MAQGPDDLQQLGGQLFQLTQEEAGACACMGMEGGPVDGAEGDN